MGLRVTFLRSVVIVSTICPVRMFGYSHIFRSLPFGDWLMMGLNNLLIPTEISSRCYQYPIIIELDHFRSTCLCVCSTRCDAKGKNRSTLFIKHSCLSAHIIKLDQIHLCVYLKASKLECKPWGSPRQSFGEFAPVISKCTLIQKSYKWRFFPALSSSDYFLS